MGSDYTGNQPNNHDLGVEHRLTSIENNTSSILNQLIQLNGKVAKHEEWITAEKLNARELKGFAAGRMSIHRRDLAILGFALATLQVVVPYALKLLDLVE